MGNELRTKITLALVTAAAASGAGWWAWRRLGATATPRRTVEFVDQSRDLEELLRDNQGGPRPATGTGPLVTPEDRETLARLFKRQGGRREFDPLTYYKLKPHLAERFEFPEHPQGYFTIATNDLGLRNDEDVLAEPPDIRVLVAGDSHTEGFCDNDESFSALLAEHLRAARPGNTVEVLNAGTSSYNHFHNLGVLEKYGPTLRPDVFVMVVFGGNDFAGSLKFQRYFRRREMYVKGPHEPATWAASGFAHLREYGFVDQEIRQLCYFANNPFEIDECTRLNAEVTSELRRLAAEYDVEPIVVYLPPPSRGQPTFHDRSRIEETLCDATHPTDAHPSLIARKWTDEIANAWLGVLDAQGVRYVDLRPIFRTHDQRVYWQTDGHINLLGHELVAEALRPIVEDVLGD
jgi:lysophospholipase L1-like esterase